MEMSLVTNAAHTWVIAIIVTELPQAQAPSPKLWHPFSPNSLFHIQPQVQLMVSHQAATLLLRKGLQKI